MRSRTTSRCPSFSRYPRSGAPPLPATRPAVGEAVPYEDLRRAAFPARTSGCRRRQDPRISNGRVEQYRGVAAQRSAGEPARPSLPGTSSRPVLAHSWWPVRRKNSGRDLRTPWETAAGPRKPRLRKSRDDRPTLRHGASPPWAATCRTSDSSGLSELAEVASALGRRAAVRAAAARPNFTEHP